MPVQSFQFSAFTLDLGRMSLRGPQGAVELRPKSFDVLRYLVEHAGQVASKDDVMASVWADVVVTEDSLTRCISEIRRALGDDAQTLVKTVPKRGYRLDVPVTVVSLDTARPTADVPATPSMPVEEPPVVSTVDVAVTPVEPATPSALAEPILSAPPAETSSRRRFDKRPGLHVASVLIAVLGGFGWLAWPKSRPLQSQTSGTLTMMAAPTIAVLPFTVLSASNGQGVPASGLEEDFRSELARAPRGYDLLIKAAPRQGDRLIAPKIEVATLGVRYIVRGTTWVESGIQRANVQLVETETDRQIWTESFEVPPGQSGVINHVSVRVGRLLAIQVRYAEGLRPLPAKLEAGHFALQGFNILEAEPDKTRTLEAQLLFEKALALDANCIPALHGLSRTQLNQFQNAWAPFPERTAALDRANVTIERLIKLDHRSVAGHYLRGSLLRSRGDPDHAIAAFEHALWLNPSYALAHAEIGRTKIDAGRAHETIEHIEAALRLSPTDPHAHIWYFWAGMAAVHLAENKAASAWLLKARQANRNFSHSLQLLAVTYQRQGEEAQARTVMADYIKSTPAFSLTSWRRSFATPNPVATRQRKDIEDVLRRLGVPENAPAVAQR